MIKYCETQHHRSNNKTCCKYANHNTVNTADQIWKQSRSLKKALNAMHPALCQNACRFKSSAVPGRTLLHSLTVPLIIRLNRAWGKGSFSENTLAENFEYFGVWKLRCNRRILNKKMAAKLAPLHWNFWVNNEISVIMYRNKAHFENEWGLSHCDQWGKQQKSKKNSLWSDFACWNIFHPFKISE